MTRRENCRSITRYSLKTSLDQPFVSPTISTAIYQCSLSVCHHSLAKHTPSGCCRYLLPESRQEATYKNRLMGNILPSGIFKFWL